MQIRIYHYERIYHFYISSEVIEDQRPSIGFPAHSTDIEPPLDAVKAGQIPIFNGGAWEIVEDTFWQPKVQEVNYDAGRTFQSYKPLPLSMYGRQFPSYPSMPLLCNTVLVVQAICQRTRLVHQKFDLVIQLHQRLLFNDVPATLLESSNYDILANRPTLIFTYKLEIEAIVYLMRRILDSLVQLSYLLTNYQDFMRTRTITHNEIGRFLSKKEPKTGLEKIIIGGKDGYIKDLTNFLGVINDLFNSFKHCLMHDESYTIVSADVPTVTAYQAKRNNHNNEIIYHNHNLYHIMMGFQDSVTRILSNQKLYMEKSNPYKASECQ